MAPAPVAPLQNRTEACSLSLVIKQHVLLVCTSIQLNQVSTSSGFLSVCVLFQNSDLMWRQGGWSLCGGDPAPITPPGHRKGKFCPSCLCPGKNILADFEEFLVPNNTFKCLFPCYLSQPGWNQPIFLKQGSSCFWRGHRRLLACSLSAHILRRGWAISGIIVTHSIKSYKLFKLQGI